MVKKVIRRFYRFFGRVQGVGFRYTAYYAARSLGCTGYVRNEYDGSVTMEIQGSEEEIDRVIQEINQNRFIRIHKMDVIDIKVNPDEYGFDPQ
jgi:acylphosphatase